MDSPATQFQRACGRTRLGEPPGKVTQQYPYLDLADIALGVKKPAPHRRKTQAVTHDMGSKTEPYVR